MMHNSGKVYFGPDVLFEMKQMRRCQGIVDSSVIEARDGDEKKIKTQLTSARALRLHHLGLPG